MKFLIVFHEVSLARVGSDFNFDEIHFLIRAEIMKTAIDIVTGEAFNAEVQKQRVDEFWSFIRRPSAHILEKPGLLEGTLHSRISLTRIATCPVNTEFLPRYTFLA